MNNNELELSNKSKVLVWGATSSIKSLLKEIESDFNVIGFIDNNSDKWETIVFEKPVYPPSEINKISFDYVIIVSQSSMFEIKTQLLTMGIKVHRIITKYIENRVIARVNFLEKLSGNLYKNRISGSVAEIGVFRGEFAQKINQYFPDRHLYLFDTFKGFDERDIQLERQNNYSQVSTGHLKNTSVEEVMRKMEYPKNVIIKEGYFPDTATNIDDSFCFINMDLDLYQPTIAGLKLFWNKLNVGGVILIHDYYSEEYRGVQNAVEEFIPLYKNSLVTFPIGDACSIAIMKTN